MIDQNDGRVLDSMFQFQLQFIKNISTALNSRPNAYTTKIEIDLHTKYKYAYI